MKKVLKFTFTAVVLLAVMFGVDVFHAMAGDHAVGPPASGFQNPLGSNNLTVANILIRIIQWVLGISAFLAMLSLVVGGVRLVTSFGNDQGVATAKKNILWAVIGVAVIMLSYAIITVVAEILGVK